jgi:GTP cyclohydrolase I
MHDKETIVQHLLKTVIGENPDRGGLIETPHRVAKAWEHWASGYNQKAEDVLKTFEDGAENYNQIILVRDIPVYSHCEHHLAPFFGKAHVAYIPDGKIVGLSKLSRVVDIFARRLQVQERLTSQVAEALEVALQPKAVGVIVECRHLCMESRGIQRQGASTVTSAMKGLFEWDRSAKEELMRLIKD